MEKIIIKHAYYIQKANEVYTFIVDKKEYDLFYLGESLKTKKLAKETAINLLTNLGWEEEFNNIPNLKNRDLPTTDEVLKLLEKAVKNEIK